MEPKNNTKRKRNRSRKNRREESYLPDPTARPRDQPSQPVPIRKERGGGGVIVFLHSLKQLGVASTAVARARIHAAALQRL
jgi:hypothetical protein